MTNRVPFEDLKADVAIMLKVVQGTVPVIQEDAQLSPVKRLCSLMMDCWKFKPEDRPSAAQCCKEVDWMVRAIHIFSREILNTYPFLAVNHTTEESLEIVTRRARTIAKAPIGDGLSILLSR